MSAAAQAVHPSHPHGFVRPQPSQQQQQQSGQSHTHHSSLKSDPYYGHADTAKLAARFVSQLFHCPELPPPPTSATTGPPPPAPLLPLFIAYSLHRTRLPSSVTFSALYLLSRLKRRFPSARGSSGHRLFISAFMIASKVICDDTYSNKSWTVVGQGMFSLREINQMEREMCGYLEWRLGVEPSELESFTRGLKEEYARSLREGSGSRAPLDLSFLPNPLHDEEELPRTIATPAPPPHASLPDRRSPYPSPPRSLSHSGPPHPHITIPSSTISRPPSYSPTTAAHSPTSPDSSSSSPASSASCLTPEDVLSSVGGRTVPITLAQMPGVVNMEIERSQKPLDGKHSHGNGAHGRDQSREREALSKRPWGFASATVW
ncbi:hypothetical protein SISSUDRAFT_71074 [Sistotremastrum suecicum HHB10207 ss-3]|uniref:Cyclin N-terminal domain-containing protein n=1 Tax=Sistotremastrum suecicum HHB10207 ss-3 TaxID=1314776 RepID=A0A166BHP1_9AGAM|nr:hypothetical protein SISSUDRAFT_71074 [Sistotremastrum suecicum HHB10207 ss-3]